MHEAVNNMLVRVTDDLKSDSEGADDVKDTARVLYKEGV